MIRIQGGAPLCGTLSVQGSKNAALPVMAASLLIPGKTVLENCPEISDTACMCEILKSVGAKVSRKGKQVIIDASIVSGYQLPREQVIRMRSSVVLMGALLGRLKKAAAYYPGGCVIGDRPIDLHLKAFRCLGARISEEDDMLRARAKKLKGSWISFSFPSVGATENALLAAVCAEGVTHILGCAREPEIWSLCDFLNGAGAKITGGGTSHICVEGVSSLNESSFTIPGDRIVAGTYLIGALAAGGQIGLQNAPVCQMESLIETAERMGAAISRSADGLYINSDGNLRSPQVVRTESYPGFPTDLQSPMLVAMAKADGSSRMQERIFNGRFGVVEQLRRMGAGISVDGDWAYVSGNSRLAGCSVTAQELRGGAALVLAGVCAEGITYVHNRKFIDRGYEDICGDLRKLGVKIGEETEL